MILTSHMAFEERPCGCIYAQDGICFQVCESCEKKLELELMRDGQIPDC